MNERIKKLRKELNLTQNDFAEHIGLKQNSIALIESGKRNISNQAILSICREFDVNEDWLRTGEGEMFIKISRDEEIAGFIGRVLTDDDVFRKRFISMLARLKDSEWELLKEKALELVSDKEEIKKD